MASKSSFFSLSGGQNTFFGTVISAGGTFAAQGAGLYFVNRAAGSALSFDLPSNTNVPFALAVYIKDSKGDAGTYPITVTDPSGFLIDGQPQLVLNTPYASATIVWSGNGWSQVA